MTVAIDQLDMDEVLANSYRDFHAKGLHYICLKRTPEITEKLYFFDGDTARLGEVVNPHDHRYDFTTTCLAGSVRNHLYSRVHPNDYQRQADATSFHRFEWRTPLNGGDGFTLVGKDRLIETSGQLYTPGRGYLSNAEEIHTISVKQGTVLRLRQYIDRHSVDVPSNTYSPRENIPVDDLYGAWTADQVVKQLRILNEYRS